ncbi:MAG: 2-phosphosulfolactate phosphatase [Phycisphaerae bacterium]|nr:2-phosphosulfolactate phosphatase [Phycisphaerae bacterium]
MPAPDAAAPTTDPSEGRRPTHVHLVPAHVEPEALRGGVVVMIDNLRASVTIAAALAAGAARVIPTLTVEEALAGRGGGALLGGERGGVLIPGFDLDNSPASYTPERVAGREVVFTTTNGTAALRHAGLADRVLVGSMANLSALCAAVAADERPVHLLCAGTGGRVSLDDCLPAGAMVERLVGMGRMLAPDDAGRLCLAAWRGRLALREGLRGLMRESRGGRNLVRIGLGADVEFCSLPDTIPVVPAFDAGDGAITLIP